MPSTTNAQIARIEAMLEEEEPTGSLRRSALLRELSALRAKRFDELADQEATIGAVVKFAKELRGTTPDRLGPVASESVEAVMSKVGRLLERERVGAELLMLLEEAGVDIHA